MEFLNPIQILPAEKGWRAIFIDPSTKELLERQVVSWALCQPSNRMPSGGARHSGEENLVVGIVFIEGRMLPADDNTTFVAYLEPTMSVDQFLAKAKTTSAKLGK
jgi:hypothetical protein